MEQERMPRVNLSKDALKLTLSDLHYMKQVEEQNFTRATRWRKMRIANRVAGTLLGALAIGIYSYTIFAVRQEKFLDDFEEPEKISDDQ